MIQDNVIDDTPSSIHKIHFCGDIHCDHHFHPNCDFDLCMKSSKIILGVQTSDNHHLFHGWLVSILANCIFCLTCIQQISGLHAMSTQCSHIPFPAHYVLWSHQHHIVPGYLFKIQYVTSWVYQHKLSDFIDVFF